MNRTVTYHITEADANMQILNFLRSKGFSRHILSSMSERYSDLYLAGNGSLCHNLYMVSFL